MVYKEEQTAYKEERLSIEEAYKLVSSWSQVTLVPTLPEKAAVSAYVADYAIAAVNAVARQGHHKIMADKLLEIIEETA